MNLISLNILYGLFHEYLVVTDIFKTKNIKQAIIYHCYDMDKLLILHKFLNTKMLKVTSRQINKNNSFKLNYSHWKLGIVIDTSCPKWFQNLHFVESLKDNTWIFITGEFGSTVNTLAGYAFDVDSDVTILTKRIGTRPYVIFDIFNNGFYTNGTLNVRQIGVWDTNLHLSRNVRYNLSGVVLKCAVVITEHIDHQTFERYLELTTPPTVDSVHKLKFYRLLIYLQHMFKFSYEFRRTNSWGYVRNGTFEGMVGALQRREVDIGGSAIFMRSDRAKVINYVAQVWPTRPCFLFRNPKHPGGYSTIYTRPLTVSVWYSILAVLVLVRVMLGFMLKLKKINPASDKADSSMSLLMIIIVGAITQQGIEMTPRSVSTKIVFLTTLLFSLTLYQYYNGAVVSTLLREPPRTIRDLKGLLESNLQIGVENVLYNKDYFKRTIDPLAQELYRRKIVTKTRKNFYDLEHGMKLVKRGGFAFHADSVSAYRYMRKTFNDRELCDIQEVELYPPQVLGAVLKKGSPYREQVVVGICRMSEAGLLVRLRNMWDEPRPACALTADASLMSVNIREFSMALIVLLAGTLLAVLVLVGEIIYFRYTVRIPYRNYR